MMNISISAKNMELDEELKSFVEDRVSRLTRYIDYQINADIYLGMEKHRHQVHIVVKGKKLYLNSESEDPANMRKAVDQCVDKLEKQLRRGKDDYKDEKIAKEALKKSTNTT